MGTHPIFESDFDCLTARMEVVKEDLNSIDKWVTGLVDLIPTQVYISKDMRPEKTDDEKKLTQGEKRKRRLDPDQCLTTSKLAFMTMNGDDSKTVAGGGGGGGGETAIINPSDLKAKFDAKMQQFAEARNLKPKTEEDQEQLRAKRKEKTEKKQKQRKMAKKVENGIKSPQREMRDTDTGKVIFNKFDLVQDPLEKKQSLKKKVPLKVRAKFVEQKEKRLADMESENPEKAEAQREKKRWQNAEMRLKGEKVLDDARQINNALKRAEKKKAASKRKWTERTEKLQEEMKQKQDKRTENLKTRSLSRQGKKGGQQGKMKKKGKPGF